MDRRTEKTMIDIFRRRGILSYQSSDEVGLSKIYDPEYDSKLSQDYEDWSRAISNYYERDCISDYTKYKDIDNPPSIHSMMKDYIIYNKYYNDNCHEFVTEMIPNVSFDYFVEVYIK